jgi:hypothetical protein
MVMTEKNEPVYRFKPIFGYLALLIVFSIGVTILVSLDKGWEKGDLPELSRPVIGYIEPPTRKN